MRNTFFPGTMTIRVPELLSRLVTAESLKRNFLKKDGRGNENEFFNKMLPGMLAYREYKKGYLRDYLDKTIKSSIATGMQDKILDFLAESFDYKYFDKSEYECNSTVNLRFDVENERLYADLFVRLDNIGIKRSAYLRNLMQEYFSLAEYQKERICFKNEYDILLDALNDEIIVQITMNKKSCNAYPLSLEYSVKSEHWYFLYFEEGDYGILHSIPLYKIDNILLLYCTASVPDDRYSEQIYSIIETEEFDSKESFELGGIKNA